jgi:8-oxo-dGTP pyrophosphatase MutT (NUDIX family)
MTLAQKFFSWVRKSQPLSSQVHVPTAGSEVDKFDMQPPLDNLEATILKAAFGWDIEDVVHKCNEPVAKGGPGSGPQPGGGSEPKTLDEHEQNTKAHEKRMKSAGRAESKAKSDYVHRGGTQEKWFAARDAHDQAKKDYAQALGKYVDYLKAKLSSTMHNVHKAAGPRRVATVAIHHGDHVLMGKRRDNGKWTMPGGHVDPGEDFDDGALREVEEETGIKLDPDHLEQLQDVHKIEDQEGKALHVQPYRVQLSERPSTTMKADPDGEVHRWKWVNVKDGLPDEIADNLHVPAERNVLLQRLGLATNPDSDDGVTKDGETGEDTDGPDNLDSGLNIDLGSGQSREPNHLGIDLYPYDDDTLIHDLHLGIPLPDESCANVRMSNALHEMDDPKPLLAEIGRVLMPGGQFHYQGPNWVENQPEWLEETDREEAVAKGNEGQPDWVKQTFTRRAVPDPSTANESEPRTGVAQYDMLPADALLAMDATSYVWSDATSSGHGNRAHGYPSQGALVTKSAESIAGKGLHHTRFCPIFKASKARQLVYCVVLSPEEMDEQEDFMTAEDIEQAAHNYLLKSRVIGSNHTKPINAAPVECFIMPCDYEATGGQYGPQKVKKGAWCIVIKIFDKTEWGKVEDGFYRGVSVGGIGARDPMVA